MIKYRKWQIQCGWAERGRKWLGAKHHLHLSVSVCVGVQQEFDGVSLIRKFGVWQLWSEALEQLGNLFNCHCKRLDGLQDYTFSPKPKKEEEKKHRNKLFVFQFIDGSQN